MEISFINRFYQPAQNKPEHSIKLPPLPYDSVSFGAMKKHQFQGIDLRVVNEFKAPIEKFNTEEDFQNWCGDKIDEITSKEYTGRKSSTALERRELLNEWCKCIAKNNYSNSTALFILNSVTKNQKINNDKLPPMPLDELLKSTLRKIKISSSYGQNTDFSKLYNEQMSKKYLNCVSTGWVVIPSAKSDPKNYEENAQKFRALSCKGWCTNGEKARRYLEKHDIHLFVKDGITKACIIVKDNEVQEIQGELNNWRIPLDYRDIIKQYIQDNSFTLNTTGKNIFSSTEETQVLIEENKILLKEAIEHNDAETIFNHFGIKTKRMEDGLLEISEFRQPDLKFTYNELGIDEDKLLEQVGLIKGDAKFYGSKAQSTGSVREIGGDADLKYSAVKTLNRLKSVSGNLDLRFGATSDLGDLEHIKGSLYTGGTPLKSLKNLSFVGRNADFRGSNIKDYGKLEHIGLNAFVPIGISDEIYDYLDFISECGVYYR